MPVYDLPMRNEASAPRFDEDNPRELASYFEELEYLFEKYKIGHPVQRKWSAVRYVSVDVRELWQCAAAWDDPTRSYEDFKAEVYAFYPETTSAFRYTRDLDVLVNERAGREMRCIEELGAFYRKFIIISTFLVKKNRLSKLEQARWFLCAFSGDQAMHLRQRLELKYPDADIDDTPNLVDIFEEAQFVLRRQLYSAQTGATAPEAPRYQEKRNAMIARPPTAAAFAMASSTPSTTSSAILAPAGAPLTPDTATEPRQNGATVSTAISTAPSTPQAISGSLSDLPPVVELTSSQSGTSRDRRRMKRSANDSNYMSVVGNASPAASLSAMGPPMEHVVPLQVSANRWVATSTHHNADLDDESPEMVERKVKALLNKLTEERYSSISDQIIAWANKSEQQMDGQTLIQVIKLVFENGTNDAMFSEMYARLCRKIMEKVSPKVQDHTIKNGKNGKGKPSAGGQLFRKYLVDRCQEDFERGWVAKETTANQAVKDADEKTKSGEESVLYSDEYYAANKARRRKLGLIRFLGELFKLQMLTERIIHGCIKKLLANMKNPEEDESESLATLLTTVGSRLDTEKARAQLDLYFLRMQELTKNKSVNPRAMFKLQDVIELRKRGWVPRNTITTSMTATGTQPKADDPSQCGDINKATPTSSPSKKGDPKNRDPPVSHLTFLKPHNSDATPESPTSKAAGVTSDPAPQRRKLKLLPRTRPVIEEPKVSTPSVSEVGSDDETVGAAMAEAAAKAKIEENFKEFFSIRKLDAAESYFSGLPTEHRHLLVDILVMKAVHMKEPDVKLVRDLFVRVRLRGLCSPEVFEEGFSGLAELLDDLAVDIPKVWSYFVMLLKGSGLDRGGEQLARIAEKTMDPFKLNSLL